jgi:hypothetical protein
MAPRPSHSELRKRSRSAALPIKPSFPIGHCQEPARFPIHFRLVRLANHPTHFRNFVLDFALLPGS